MQDLDGRLALKETGVVTSLEDIHDKGANPKQHQPTWEPGPAGEGYQIGRGQHVEGSFRR